MSQAVGKGEKSRIGKVFDDIKDRLVGANDAETEDVGVVDDTGSPLPVVGSPAYEPHRASQETIDKLNECLRGELSAVESYDLALGHVKDEELASVLRQIRDSHDRRITWIRDYLRSTGAEPSLSSGVWGAFAKVVQIGADLFGDHAAIGALTEGEEHGLEVYSTDLDDIELAARDFIQNELYPEQRRSRDLCRSLDRFVKAA